MALVNDAISARAEAFNDTIYFSKGRLNEKLLKEMMNDLDETEIISIIFLMTDESTNISQVIDILKTDYVIKFIGLSKVKNWEEKLLEILIIIGNINVIRKLGYNQNEIEAMKQRFVCSEHNVSANLNRVIKSLYFLCSYLNSKQVERLINEVNKWLKEPIPLDENKVILELYILQWLQQKYISIDQPDLNNLLKCLKIIGCSCDLPFNFDSWQISSSTQKDSLKTLKNDNSLQFISCNRSYNGNDANSPASRPEDHKRLCIIINETNFTDSKKYPMRQGSEKDEGRLKEVFKGLKFEVISHHNLTSNTMMVLLKSLNKPPYNEYGCIFICILSHGSKGEVVFSDDEKIPIETIKTKFCCENLQHTLKFVILQACQGKRIGQLEPKLVADGPETPLKHDSNENPLYYEHFGLFRATVENFAAMRHESEGSWFIQDICDELEQSTPIDISEWVRKVINRVSKRRYKYVKKNMDKFGKEKTETRTIVQLPEFINSITEYYVLPKYQNMS